MEKNTISALHEAGHCVVAHLQNIQVESVRVIPDGKYGGETCYREPKFKRRSELKKYAYARIVTSYASHWVSLKIVGDNQLILDILCGPDYSSARYWAKKAYPKQKYIQDLHMNSGLKEVEQLVNTKEVWEKIELLAKLLEQKKDMKMTGKEVSEIVDSVKRM